jgi:sensor histidine kinase YesM
MPHVNWHEFVFSKNKPQRYLRHLVFWLIWGLYFFISMDSLPRQTNAAPRPTYSLSDLPGFIHLLLTLTIHILGCYLFIYYILSRYLLRSKYLLAFISILLLGFIMVQSVRFADTVIMPFLFQPPSKIAIPYYASVYTGVISAIKIISVAIAIKLIKHWWFKQKEKEKLEKERIEAELQLLKAQIHPGFLFNTLNDIYSFTLTASPKAPEMLLKLSDILSYMLYECDDREVPLEKEIKMLKSYMALEKARYGGNLEMNVQVKGDISQQKIAPLLLLGFIENSFKQCNHSGTEQPWINFELVIENHKLHLKLMNGKPAIRFFTEDREHNDVVQTRKRLDLIYPGTYELNIMEEDEIMMVTLTICLQQAPANRKGDNEIMSQPEVRKLVFVKE